MAQLNGCGSHIKRGSSEHSSAMFTGLGGVCASATTSSTISFRSTLRVSARSRFENRWIRVMTWCIRSTNASRVTRIALWIFFELCAIDIGMVEAFSFLRRAPKRAETAFQGTQRSRKLMAQRGRQATEIRDVIGDELAPPKLPLFELDPDSGEIGERRQEVHIVAREQAMRIERIQVD